MTETLATTHWTLQTHTSASAEHIPLESAPITLTLDSGGQRVTGSSGCNTYSAKVTLESPSITIATPTTTLKACADDIMEQELTFLEALPNITTLEIEEEQLILSGNEQRLVFARDNVTSK
ncbi:MAG: META domain-containing protein [Trueperaceae bacterium]